MILKKAVPLDGFFAYYLLNNRTKLRMQYQYIYYQT